jgi:hypothetical protein
VYLFTEGQLVRNQGRGEKEVGRRRVCVGKPDRLISNGGWLDLSFLSCYISM